MHHTLRSMLLCALVGVAPGAFAQATQADPNAAVQPIEPPAYLTDTQADLDAIMDARIAALQTVLRLTPEQESLFEPVAQAIRQGVEAARKRDEARYSGEVPANFLDVLDTIVEGEAERGRHLTAIVEAFRPLAAQLDDEQLRRVPPFLGMVDLPYGEQPSAQLWIVSE